MVNTSWKLKPGISMDANAANEVAKIACALKSLSVYTQAVCEEDTEDSRQLKRIVDDGLEAMTRVFEW
ncbi:MAG: hypothetical protein ACYC2R_13655 [Burkholderiales bacterium]|nr:hypothetical protein [Sulfuricellaceae bacterium]